RCARGWQRPPWRSLLAKWLLARDRVLVVVEVRTEMRRTSPSPAAQPRSRGAQQIQIDRWPVVAVLAGHRPEALGHGDRKLPRLGRVPRIGCPVGELTGI